MAPCDWPVEFYWRSSLSLLGAGVPRHRGLHRGLRPSLLVRVRNCGRRHPPHAETECPKQRDGEHPECPGTDAAESEQGAREKAVGNAASRTCEMARRIRGKIRRELARIVHEGSVQGDSMAAYGEVFMATVNREELLWMGLPLVGCWVRWRHMPPGLLSS